MKKSLLFAVCFISAFPLLRAQQPDSLMQEIVTNVSISVQISNGRQILLEEMLAGNEQKAAGVRNYLKSRTQNTPYMAFMPMEFFLSMYWTGDYGEILESTASADSESLFARPSDSLIWPTYDELAMKLPKMSKDSLPMLERKVDEAISDLAERDYLKIVLHWLAADDLKTLREVFDEARTYLTQNPLSPYKSFLSNTLIYDLEESKWGWGIFFGIGPAFFDGQTKNDFNNPAFGMFGGVDLLYRNLYMGSGIFVAATGLKRDITFRGYDFTPDADHMTVLGLDLRAGYKLLDTPRFTLVPYGAAGVSGMTIKRKEDENYSREGVGFTYGGGVFLDVKFPSRRSAEYILTGRESSYGSLRLRYHITAADYKLPSTEKTIMHWLTIEFGGLTRKTQRVKH
jgi:hypothetical protein